MVVLVLSACLVNTELYERRMGELADDDGDGYSVEQGDCDDGDGSVYPGADEVCDGVDQDCDGEIDDDAVDVDVWYVDGDGDGYGGDEVVACEQPEGAVANSDDCDDGDADVNPVAAETWYDGIDQNCAGDDDYDADGDGDALEEYGGTDCNDDDAEVSGTGVEGWLDIGTDNDCDGDLDDQIVLDPSTFDLVEGPGEAAEFGHALTVLPEGWGDDERQLVVSAGSYDDYRGAIYAWGESSIPGSVSAGDADWTVVGSETSPEFLGAAVGWAGDAKNPVVHVAAVTGEQNRGVVYGFTSTDIGGDLTDRTFRIVGETKGMFVGGPAVSGADLDGDGINDLITSAIQDSRQAGNGGSVAVFLEPDLLSGEVAYTDADLLFTVDIAAAKLAPDLTGDLDQDGTDDLALSTRGLEYPDPHGALIYSLPASGEHEVLATAEAILYSSVPASSADVDGDGELELFALNGEVAQYDLPLYGSVTPWDHSVAASGFDDSAIDWASAFYAEVPYWDGRRGLAASVAYDNQRGAAVIDVLAWELSTNYSDAKYLIVGEQAGDTLGAAAAFLDLDDDGADDLVLSSPGYDGGTGSDSGAVYLIPGPR